MTDEITDINPSDVEFLEELREGKHSSILKVLVRGRLCVMKVVSKPSLRLSLQDNSSNTFPVPWAEKNTVGKPRTRT